MREVRIAIIGTSGMASVYCNLALMSKRCRIVSVHSRSNERGAKFAKDHRVPQFSNQFDDVLLTDVDAVLICTEPARHVDVALELMKWNKHILIEKPLDISVEKAKVLLNSEKNYKKTISIVSQYRFDPALRTMKKEYSRLAPKTPTTASLIFHKHRDRRYYENGTGWRSKEGPVFLNQGIHWLDIMNWFFGNPLECTSKAYITRSFLKCADLGVAMLCYPNNTFAVIQGGTFSCDQSTEKFSIVHSNGIIDYNTFLESERNKSGLMGVSQKALRRLKLIPQIKDASLMMLEDFCESIINDRTPEVSLEDGYNALVLGKQLSLLSDSS